MIEFQWGLCKFFKRSSVIFSLIISFILTILFGFHKIPLTWLGQISKCLKTENLSSKAGNVLSTKKIPLQCPLAPTDTWCGSVI